MNLKENRKLLGLFASLCNDKFIIDENNELKINQLYEYFVLNRSDILDIKKGILLYGDIGCGKTVLMKGFSTYTFNKNLKTRFEYFTVRQIAHKYETGGYKAVNELLTYKERDEYFNLNEKNIDLCFDDLGTASNAKYYGNDFNVIHDILPLIYA